MSLQALLGVVRHLVVERIGVDVNYEVVRHLFGLLGSGWVELAGLRHPCLLYTSDAPTNSLV
mgnify:CR=1 FL=1